LFATSDKLSLFADISRACADGAVENAVASFFTPLSKKPPEKTIWQERAPEDKAHSTLLVGRYESDDKSGKLVSGLESHQRRKIAAFDFVRR
jgi:bifunctional polynucleotide phosphatase/kinase